MPLSELFYLFETERLRVRRITSDDFDAMYAAYSDPVAMRFVGDGSPISREDCARWIQITLSRYETHGYAMSLAEAKEGGEVVGFVGLVHPGGQPEPELKYTLMQAYWGNGYASELAQGMMGYAAEVLGMVEVIATVDAEHLVSQRVLTKAGFTRGEPRLEEDGSSTEVYRWVAPAA